MPSWPNLTHQWNQNMLSTPTLIEFSWPTPITLEHHSDQPMPYPTHCLPTIIQEAVTSYQAYGKQPFSLIACSALANVSLACQAQANVARDRILVSPISLYFLSISPSGSRKSSIDSAFSQAIRQWEFRVREELAPAIRDARAVHQAWVSEKDAIISQIRKAAVREEDTSSLKAYLLHITANEPVTPLMPSLFFEDTTQEAIASRLALGWPSASIWSDEGGIVLSGYGMQNSTTKFVALLNRLWDGKDFVSHRKTSRSFTIANRRLTVSLMLQPLIMQQMIEKNQGVARQSGFMARSLIAYPASSMGTRFYEEPPESLANLQSFHDRLIECLDASLSLDQTGCAEIPTLTFSSKAKSAWVKQFNDMEAGLLLADQWASITDFASKAAENAARLAALFHLFDGKDGQINCENIERAIEIVRWHLSETKRILAAPQEPAESQDAQKLLKWLIGKSIKNTTPQYLQQYSPLREKKRRDMAIDILIEHHYLRKINNAGKTHLLLNPKSI